jgi:uncharacterized protein
VPYKLLADKRSANARYMARWRAANRQVYLGQRAARRAEARRRRDAEALAASLRALREWSAGYMPDGNRVPLHEAGHSVVASLLGRAPVTATVEGGPVLAGCSRWTPVVVAGDDLAGWEISTPYVLWPQALRWRLETDVMILLAGEAAVAILAPVQVGRVADPVHVVAAEMAGQMTGAEDRMWAAEVVRAALPSDAEQVATAVFTAFGGDSPREATAWLAWLRAQTETLIITNGPAVQRLAAVLAECGTVGAPGVAACLG